MAQQVPQHSLAIIRYDSSSGIDQFLVVQGSIYGYINIGEGRIKDFLSQIYNPAAGLEQWDIDALNRWASVYKREEMTAEQGLNAHIKAIKDFLVKIPSESEWAMAIKDKTIINQELNTKLSSIRDKRRVVNENLTFQQIIDLYALRDEPKTLKQIIEEILFPIESFPVAMYHLDLTPDSTRCRLMIPRTSGGYYGFVKGGIEAGDIIGPNDGMVLVRGVATSCAVEPTTKKTVIREIGEELGLEQHIQWATHLQPAFQRISIPIGQTRDTKVFLCPLSTEQDRTIKPIIDHYARNRNRNQEIFNPRWVIREELEEELVSNTVNGISKEALALYRQTALNREQEQTVILATEAQEAATQALEAAQAAAQEAAKLPAVQTAQAAAQTASQAAKKATDRATLAEQARQQAAIAAGKTQIVAAELAAAQARTRIDSRRNAEATAQAATEATTIAAQVQTPVTIQAATKAAATAQAAAKAQAVAEQTFVSTAQAATQSAKNAAKQAQEARYLAETAIANAERERLELAARATEREERASQDKEYSEPKDGSRKRTREKYLKYKAKYLHLKKLLEQMKI